MIAEAKAPSGLRYRWMDFKYRMRETWIEFCEDMKWIGYKPSGLERHAQRELELAFREGNGDPFDAAVIRDVMSLVRLTAQQDHSGGSIGIVLSLFSRVSGYGLLTPLTGEDDEWMEVSDGIFQNIRCGHVFKENGEAYDINGKIFRETYGTCYTNSVDSRVPVTFPYTPKTEYVDVPTSFENWRDEDITEAWGRINKTDETLVAEFEAEMGRRGIC